MAQKFDRLSKGDLVLVTGVSGLIGSVAAEEALRFGFRVRGVSRDKTKLSELSAKFAQDFPGQFEVVEVQDITKPELFVPHLQNVRGVLHVASDVSFRPQPREVIDHTVAATVGLMKAAAQVPSVKAFVLTSSRIAAFQPPQPGEKLVVAKDTFLEGVTEQALSLPANHPSLPVLSYAASKIEGEKAAWAYYKSAKPSYAFSAVLPDLVLGTPANPRRGAGVSYSTYSMFMDFYGGSFQPGQLVHSIVNPPSAYVAVRDVALAHVIALAASEVNEERIFAITGTFCARDFAESIRKVEPEWDLPGETAKAALRDSNGPSDLTVPNESFFELIEKYAGRSALNLDQVVAEMVQN
jgi:nucleoside-diphosphate-sugar epimerase